MGQSGESIKADQNSGTLSKEMFALGQACGILISFLIPTVHY